MGDPNATCDRYGRRPRSVYLPEPEHEFVAGRPQLQELDVNAFPFLEKGIEDGYLLLATQGKAPGTTIHD